MTDSAPFGQARAQEIWDARGPQWSVHPTEGEDAYVQYVWSTMPGHTCWMDAFFRILNGTVVRDETDS